MDELMKKQLPRKEFELQLCKVLREKQLPRKEFELQLLIRCKDARGVAESV
jgi:hypothetical protein